MVSGIKLGRIRNGIWMEYHWDMTDVNRNIIGISLDYELIIGILILTY